MPKSGLDLSSLKVRSVTESEVEEAADLTASAFLYSPNYTYIFDDLKNSEKRHSALKWMFWRHMRLRIRNNSLFGGFFRDELVCFFILEPSSLPPVTLWDMLSVGLLEMPFRFGLRAVNRMLERSHFYDEISKTAVQTWSQRKGTTEPAFFILGRMVVKPRYQGMGIGTYCLGQVVREVTKSGYAVYLTTQKEQNVTFYRRLGFQLIYKRNSGLSEPDRHMIAISPSNVIKTDTEHKDSELSETQSKALSRLATSTTSTTTPRTGLTLALPGILVSSVALSIGIAFTMNLRRNQSTC